MTRIVYLLNRFPRITDTFIMREVRALQKSGMEIYIISIWKPNPGETNDAIMEEWKSRTCFLLPQSIFSVGRLLCLNIIRSPKRFASTAWLALKTARPGLRGLIKQSFYLAEAMLIAEMVRGRATGHFHNHFGDHGGIVTMLTARLCNIPYSISFHGPHVFFDGGAGRIKEKVLQAQFVRCISYFCRSQVILYSGSTDLSALKIVHCGLDLDKYRFSLPREKVTRLYSAARLAPEKGYEFLLRAIKIVADQQYEIELRIAGDGPNKDALETLTQELRIAERVHFLGLIDDGATMRELYAADLFVLPSLAEGLPTSIIEALAAGVPVIATNVGGTSELVEHGRTGLLVQPSDSQAIANAIIRMIKSYDFRTHAAEFGRQKVVEEFDVNKEAAKLREYFLQSSQQIRELSQHGAATIGTRQ